MSASWKTVRVFISSTFRDMQAERDWLVRFVFPKLREDLVKYRIHLIDVDLRWGVTSDQDALGVCREVIDECHPRFMGILGGRYGWVPEGRTESITADEVHYGVLKREAEKRGDAFFYFRDPAATSGMMKEVPGEFREPEGSSNAQKLADLKQSIADAGLPVFIYPAQWDAAQKRLTGLEAFGSRVHDNLLQSLKADPELASRFTADSTAQPDEFQEEAEQMDAFIEGRTERFVLGSRKPVLDGLETFATADPSVTGSNILVLTGEPGSGKSAFLAKFTRDLSDIRHSSFVIPHFIGASTGSTDLRRMLRRLCHELARAAGNTESLPLDIKELITRFQKLLIEASAKQRVILVFDALNQFDAMDGAHWLNWLPRELPPGVRIVASVIAPAEGEKEHQTLAILKNRKDVRVEELKPLSESDTLAIIEGYLKRYSKRFSAEQIAALKEKPASNLPLYVLTALEELRTLGTYEEITARIRALPGDARALFGWILTERLARDPGFRDRDGRPCGAALVGKFAACLGVSRHGLFPAELTALLDPGDPLGNVAALLRLLRPYLMRRGELLDFYHGQFREAAEAAHLNTLEKQRAAHQSVATCLHAFADPHRDGQCRDATPHALSELPHHQTQAGEATWPALIATLENIFFLEAKVTHGMAFDLAEDFAAAVDALPTENVGRKRLRLLGEALRRDIHFVARHAKDYPQALFQCLWNSAWWYDCAEAALRYMVPEGGWDETPPWDNSDSPLKLCTLLESWRTERKMAYPRFPWLCAESPPAVSLDSGLEIVLEGHNEWTKAIAFSPDSKKLAAGSSREIRLWDISTGRELVVLNGVDSAAMKRLHPCDVLRDVICLSFSPDGTRIAGGAADGIIRLWCAETGRQVSILWSVILGHSDSIDDVAFSPDGRLLASASWDTTVRVWSTRDGRLIAILRGCRDWVSRVKFSRDGNRILSESYHKLAFTWDTPAARRFRILGLVWSCLMAFMLRLYDKIYEKITTRFFMYRNAETPSQPISEFDDDPEKKVFELLSHYCQPKTLATSFDHKLVASAELGKRAIRVWNLESLSSERLLKGHKADINRIAFSPDGLLIATASEDESIIVWDRATLSPMKVLDKLRHAVTCLNFSNDGTLLASGQKDGEIIIWSAITWRMTKGLWRQREWINDVAFAQDGKWIVAGGSSASARLWEVSTGRLLGELGKHDNGVTAVAVNATSNLAATASQDLYGLPKIRVWDMATGNLASEMYSDWGDLTLIDRLSFSQDDQRIIAIASNHYQPEMQVWNWRNAELLEIIQGVGDAKAIMRNSTEFPLRAVSRQSETIVETSASGSPVAWFPDALTHITTDPEGRTWAGSVGSHLVLLRLEGG